MLAADDNAKFRLPHHDGPSICEIARTFDHSRLKVRELLARPQPKPYARTSPLRTHPRELLRHLANCQAAPRWQRHTATLLHGRLGDEYGNCGGHDQVHCGLCILVISTCHLNYR